MLLERASAAELRARLAEARVMLLFTPAGCRNDPLAVLEAALPYVDVVQVRIEDPTDPDRAAPARALLEWTRRVAELIRREREERLILVNDRVDVARLLADEGAAHGTHVGADDYPVVLTRSLLGARPLIGLSTHDVRSVASADPEVVDYLGFGPVYPSATKGYERGLGPESAWVADSGTSLPIFPIGGIDHTNAADLTRVGRAAVSSAILGAAEPGASARVIRDLVAG